MTNLKQEGAADKGGATNAGNKARKQPHAVLILDTREEFLLCITQAQGEKTVFLTATTEPPLMPSKPAKVGAVYALLSFNLGTSTAPRLAYYVEPLDVTELEWVSDFLLKDGSAQAIVEAELVIISQLLTEAGATVPVTVRRGRWQLAEVWVEG